MSVCKKCGSGRVYKDGKRLKRVGGRVVKRQAYLCANCFHQWVEK